MSVGCQSVDYTATLIICFTARYVIAHVFGRRAMYPGSTAIVQTLMGETC